MTETNGGSHVATPRHVSAQPRPEKPAPVLELLTSIRNACWTIAIVLIVFAFLAVFFALVGFLRADMARNYF